MVPRSYIHELLIVFVASLLFPTWNFCSPQSTQASPNASSSRSATGTAAGNAAGATSSGTSSGSATTNKGESLHGIYLVFPFQNSGPSSRLDWLSEGLEELTIQSLSSAGEQVYSHSWRLGELERYGIPTTAKLSRATMLHVAEDLDADFVVFGSFNYDGKNMTIDSRLLRVNPAALLPSLHESGPLETVMDLHTRLMWRMLSENDHSYPLSLTEFNQMHKAVRLDAFEHYVRGLIANEDETRVRELREAVRLEPEWVEPNYALGETYFTKRDCASALPWYAKVPKTHDRYLEALFSIGVCRLTMNQPDQAEQAFATLQILLRSSSAPGVDFPEVLNNLAIAKARQNKFPAAQEDLKRASALDPDEDDYPFNLGLIAMRQGDFNGAAMQFREASHREPDIPEDRSLLVGALEKAGKQEEADQERNAALEAFGPSGVTTTHLDAKNDSLTHIERVTMEIDPETLRFEMESAEARASTGGPQDGRDTAATHLRRARQDLSGGQLDAAEHEYHVTLATDKGNAAAHLGLGEIARRQGRLEDAVKELQLSLEARDSAVVRTTLARVYLEQKKPALARAEVEHALKLAPNYAEAKQLLEYLQNGKPAEVPPKGGPR
ncbi:MAG TPA: tetratricopeptide repeat protein [Methylomirabilota bacterium]|jgi:tetratricopeptide (TPR) repeat protein/TolB-like protein|nr:tetratricopeptide repeat protein [Methylomirabilota bacterium]